MRRKFYFNTGVHRYAHNPPIPLMPGEEWNNNIKVIPFYCDDVPETAAFLYACDIPDLDKNDLSVIVREIHDSTLISKYAYFKI